MQCRVFVGDTPAKVMDSYNEWAKEKQLAKDVIIHTAPQNVKGEGTTTICITVYFDEKIHPGW